MMLIELHFLLIAWWNPASTVDLTELLAVRWAAHRRRAQSKKSSRSSQQRKHRYILKNK